MSRFGEIFLLALVVVVVFIFTLSYLDGQMIVDMQFRIEHKSWERAVSCIVGDQGVVLHASGYEERFPNPLVIDAVIDTELCDINHSEEYWIRLQPTGGNEHKWEECPMSLGEWQNLSINDLVIVTGKKAGPLDCDTLVAQP